MKVNLSKSGGPPPPWLRRIVEDESEPPRLYAWTPRNLSTVNGPARANKDDDDDRRRRRIYILGVGNIGRLYAMCLSRLPDRPPITLVVHRRELLEQWASNPGIELLTRDGHAQKDVDFDIEWWTENETPGAAAEVRGKIANLIVATKAPDAIPQVDRLRRYLGRESAVAFAQNGMCKLWPPLGDAYVRARYPGGPASASGSASGSAPSWLACVTTHGVTSQGPFKSVHAAPATALVGPVSANNPQAEYLMRQIASAPGLDARRVSRQDLWIAQLEKLVVNAVINPLTAVLRCKNGELFVTSGNDDKLSLVVDNLVREASDTLTTLITDPKSDDILLRNRQELLERFSFPRLRTMVLGVGEKVAANTSSMLQDMRAGKQTEIDDFNGWLVDTANLLGKGLRLATHEELVALVKDGAELSRGELCERLLGKE
ncbi:ketoisovalerate reductase [Poronia punctata]|nr:ketoisovalerate reductase [Poronia punctata]